MILTTTGKVKISMYKYIEKLLSEFPTEMNGSTKTSATGHLLNVYKGAIQHFHHLVLSYCTFADKQDRRFKWQLLSYVPEYKCLMDKTTINSRVMQYIQIPTGGWIFPTQLTQICAATVA